MTKSTMVAEANDVESRFRSERADVARLTLQIRAVGAEIERIERTTDEWSEATERLRVQLDEAVERRRVELDAQLAAVREQAASLVADSRSRAATMPAARQQAADQLFTPTASRADTHAEIPPVSAVAAAVPPPEMPAPPRVPDGPSMMPEYLAQVVHAAVAASLAHFGAAPQPVPAGRTATNTSFRSRLLHLDVLLPLILVGIVVVVTLAWVS